MPGSLWRWSTLVLVLLFPGLLLAGCGSGGANPSPAAPALTPVALITAAAPAGSTKSGKYTRPPLSAGPQQGSAYTIVSAGRLLVAGMDSLGILVSANEGASWRPMNAGLPLNPTAIAVTPASPAGQIFALVSGQVYATRITPPFAWRPWGRQLPRGSNLQVLAYWPPSRSVLAGDGSGALYAASGPAAAWQEADQGLAVGRAAITSLLVRSGIAYAGSTNGLAYSTDGHTWTRDATFGAHDVNSLAALPNRGLAVGLDSDGLALLPRLGAHWIFRPPAALGLRAGARVLTVTNDTRTGLLYLGTLDQGIYSFQRAMNSSRSFGALAHGVPINDLLTYGDWLFAATNAGIMRLKR